jgi:hypothetical protein
VLRYVFTHLLTASGCLCTSCEVHMHRAAACQVTSSCHVYQTYQPVHRVACYSMMQLHLRCVDCATLTVLELSLRNVCKLRDTRTPCAWYTMCVIHINWQTAWTCKAVLWWWKNVPAVVSRYKEQHSLMGHEAVLCFMGACLVQILQVLHYCVTIANTDFDTTLQLCSRLVLTVIANRLRCQSFVS